MKYKGYEERMTICPKCRSRNIQGPQFRASSYNAGVLKWWCGVCGYTEETETADAHHLILDNKECRNCGHSYGCHPNGICEAVNVVMHEFETKSLPCGCKSYTSQ